MRNSPSPRRHAEAGATLIEVLVSVVVLAIGLLGAAALQAGALKNNQASYERSQMTVLAQGMLDSMRSNLTAVDAAAYQYTSWTCSGPSGSTLAKADVRRWISDLQTQINASACGQISCTGRVCTVGIQWDDSRVGGGSSTHSHSVVSRL